MKTEAERIAIYQAATQFVIAGLGEGLSFEEALRDATTMWDTVCRQIPRIAQHSI